MARTPREDSDTVALTLRIREDLRRRIQEAADGRQFSINREIIERLENSFLVETNARLIEVLLSSGGGLVLLRLIASALRIAGDGWLKVDDREEKRALYNAIKKLADLFIFFTAKQKEFPQRNVKGSADYIAVTAMSEVWGHVMETVQMKRVGREDSINSMRREVEELRRTFELAQRRLKLMEGAAKS